MDSGNYELRICERLSSLPRKRQERICLVQTLKPSPMQTKDPVAISEALPERSWLTSQVEFRRAHERRPAIGRSMDLVRVRNSWRSWIGHLSDRFPWPVCTTNSKLYPTLVTILTIAILKLAWIDSFVAVLKPPRQSFSFFPVHEKVQAVCLSQLDLTLSSCC